MATPIIMPRQGQSVESCIITAWNKKVGDTVKAGEAIALVGNTGEKTTGPHLHFEIWNRGRSLDPSKYIVF